MNLFRLKTPARTLYLGHQSYAYPSKRRPYTLHLTDGGRARALVPSWDHFALEAWERMKDGGLKFYYPWVLDRMWTPYDEWCVRTGRATRG